MEQGESAASFGGKQSQEDQQVADIGFHLKVIEPFSISLHSLGLLRSHRFKLMLWEAKKGGKFPVAVEAVVSRDCLLLRPPWNDEPAAH